MPPMRSRSLILNPFEAMGIDAATHRLTGIRLRTIDERPICLTVSAGRRRSGHPVAWVVSYAWAMLAEQAIRHCEVMGWE